MSNFSKAFLVAGVFYAVGIAVVALLASHLLMESIGILIAFSAAVWLGAHNYFESRTPKKPAPTEDSTGA
ncbi:hypothetical protein I2485_14230 [Nesterenkonia sp. E16_7]|uniref:hypothetical protein n=1 Tax=unclassified Nesterenkonia TaxID=2629769 RepID=UPI001A934561|nr:MULTISPECIES: hypothetical protein [unclassified Nesterenkonia]MBO0594610.1 hypothetical protein [Nesterenkonia sp. E16_10]MBO0599803.1 hypothetical protein [Nesterenkonia sp. E16_7]